jgi:hypothetical protein
VTASGGSEQGVAALHTWGELHFIERAAEFLVRQHVVALTNKAASVWTT